MKMVHCDGPVGRWDRTMENSDRRLEYHNGTN